MDTAGFTGSGGVSMQCRLERFSSATLSANADHNIMAIVFMAQTDLRSS